MTQTPIFDFDTPLDRRGTGCAKWDRYGDDVIPLWVADMDFHVPAAVTDALRERVEHGVFGYTMPPPELNATIVERMRTLYNWHIDPQDVVYVPGVVIGINMAARATAAGGAMLIQPPVYPPFTASAGWSNITLQEAPLNRVELEPGAAGGSFSYEVDLDAFEAAITPETGMFLLCSPHNPVGRVWTEGELRGMAEVCARHNIVICSDEIHNDLILGDVQHVPTATLSPEIAQNTITLMAPSKTFNLPGLSFSFAIIQNPDLRQRFYESALGLVTAQMGEYKLTFLNMMGTTAALAAYKHGDAWLRAVLDYMRANRDFAQTYIREYMPGLATATLEGTYLLWIDCRDANLPTPPGQWFLENARVALNEGASFGQGGEHYARLNLACPRDTLKTGLERMRDALADRD